MTLTTTRDLSCLYTCADDPQIAQDNHTFIARIDSFITKRDSDTVDYADPVVLQASLTDYESLMADYPYGTREMCYRYLRDVTEWTNETKQRLGQAEHFSREQMVRLQFFELALGKIDPSNHQRLLDHPSLQPYHHFLECLRISARYDLSRDTEKAITLLSKSAYGNRSDMIEDALKQETRIMEVDGEESDKSFEELMTLTKHANKAIRDQAAEYIHEIVAKYSYMATREINSILEYKLATDTLRGYDRPDGSRIVSEDIAPDVVDALLQTVHHTNDIACDFYALKARLLGCDKLAYHERNLTISLTDTPVPTYTYEQAVWLVRDVFADMDDDFVQVLDRMSHGWLIDVFPRQWKLWWAYNIGMGKNVINAVLLNYTNTLTDVTTLAHEMGHACHTQFVYQYQNALHANYGMLTAEVSSQFVEDYVYEYIVTDLDNTQRLELLMQQLNDSVSSIHRQIACYRYEQTIHQEYRQTGFVPTERLGELFTYHMSEYMGNAVSQDPGSEYRWVYRSHIRSFFYVFSYAGAMILAKILQSQVAAGELTFFQIKEWYYSHGRDLSPQQIFAGLGIDITDASVWQSWLGRLRDMIRQAEQLADQLWY